MITIYVRFVQSPISGRWMASQDDLLAELKKVMPDVYGYTIRGYRKYRKQMIVDITSCYNKNLADTEGLKIIELRVVPKNF